MNHGLMIIINSPSIAVAIVTTVVEATTLTAKVVGGKVLKTISVLSKTMILPKARSSRDIVINAITGDTKKQTVMPRSPASEKRSSPQRHIKTLHLPCLKRV